jgi:MGT family glycosyltransferase
MKILFATMPFDGHFNPLTGLAVHLRRKGHDVRWYAPASYAGKLVDLGIPQLPYRRALDVNAENLVEHFPEYEKLGTGPKAIAFAATKIFFGNTEAHFRDLCEVRAAFPFDALVYDGAFYAANLVADKLNVRVYGIGPGPTPHAKSTTAPPPFFGLRPAKTVLGRMRDRVVFHLVESSMKTGMNMLNDLRAREGLAAYQRSPLDLPFSSATAYFQIGTPGMDFPRDDWPKNLRWVGALMPHSKKREGRLPFEDKLARFDSMICVSQGTVDNRDPEKLFVPALQALAGGRHLVVATTGHRNTEALRRRFPQDNVIVEDFIDFDVLLEHADLFICNGGYGSIMHALIKGVPILSAGELEAKNDINARLDWRGLGLDLRSERPTAKRVAAGVARVLGDPRYRQNVARLKAELETYRPFDIIERVLLEDEAAACRTSADGATKSTATATSSAESRQPVT